MYVGELLPESTRVVVRPLPAAGCKEGGRGIKIIFLGYIIYISYVYSSK